MSVNDILRYLQLKYDIYKYIIYVCMYINMYLYKYLYI